MGQGQVGTATLPIPKAQAMVELLLDTELRLPVVLERRMAQLRLERRTGYNPASTPDSLCICSIPRQSLY
jgi:hypothetical protein